MIKLITVTLAALLVTSHGWAQQFGGGERSARTPEALQSTLSLTDDQVTALKENKRAQFEATRPLRQELMALRRQLREAMSQENPNEATVAQFLVDMREKQEEIKAAAAEYRAKAVEILDENQKTALAGLEQARQLQPAIRQATGLGLLEPAERGEKGFRHRGPRHGRFGRHRGPRPSSGGPAQL